MWNRFLDIEKLSYSHCRTGTGVDYNCNTTPTTILTEKGLCYVYNADQRMEFKKGALVEF